jgi:hypothetical protein
MMIHRNGIGQRIYVNRSLILVIVCLLWMIGTFATTPLSSAAARPSGYNRLVAVGDIHGSFVGLRTILKQTSLIDENNRWIGGNTLLVQMGDMIDRGADVKQVMDLLMSLQNQAEAKGGKVVVLLGNHEVMNMIGASQYVNPEAYKNFIDHDSFEKQEKAYERWWAVFGAAAAGGEDPEILKQKWMTDHPQGFVEYNEAIGPEGKYGKWFRSLPAVFQYGGSVFLHGGISPDFAEPMAVLNQKIDAAIKEFDDIRSYMIKKRFIEQYYSMSEMNSVVDGIVKASETQVLTPALLNEVPRLKEIRSYLATFFDVSPLMIDNGPLWFRGFANWPEQQLNAYVPEWLKRNKAWRVVVAHTPRPDGKIQSRLNGAIFVIDTGMNEEYFKGGQASALEIKDDDTTAIYQSGERFEFPPPEIRYGPAHVWTDQSGAQLPFKTTDEIEQVLLTASPVSAEVIKATTNPLKVVLEKDNYRLNAIFRSHEETDNPGPAPGAEKKIRYFRDSSQSEISAYILNRMLGMNNIPPTVFRTLNGKKGTLQLWAEGVMSDDDRAAKKMLPPEALPWNRQMWDMQVFDNLINNIDRNQTNILIDSNWQLILIDHTRSFAMDDTLFNPEKVIHCSRGLWHALRHLDEAEARKRLSPYLRSAEINALFARKQKLIQLIKGLIDRNGEENVLT